jgi:hypothetical protein
MKIHVTWGEFSRLTGAVTRTGRVVWWEDPRYETLCEVIFGKAIASKILASIRKSGEIPQLVPHASLDVAPGRVEW